jgi:hypothetical protein
MQNVKPTDLPCVTEHLSTVSSAISRVVGIVPAPLLPGEKETDYAEVALRIIKAATPRDAIEDLLTRRRHRLILGRSSAAPIEGRAFEGRD